MTGILRCVILFHVGCSKACDVEYRFSSAFDRIDASIFVSMRGSQSLGSYRLVGVVQFVSQSIASIPFLGWRLFGAQESRE